jgi:ornithine cyclodeaminase
MLRYLSKLSYRQFARHMSKRHGITVEPVETARAAVQGTDIICTTTPALEPIFFGDWIMDGAHLNAIGSCAPQTRELDTDAVAKSRLFVDRRESTLNEAGDFLIPKREGAIGDDHILGEIGDILVGNLDGRKSESEITLFKSLGLAVEDQSSAQYVYRKAYRYVS